MSYFISQRRRVRLGQIVHWNPPFDSGADVEVEEEVGGRAGVGVEASANERAGVGVVG